MAVYRYSQQYRLPHRWSGLPAANILTYYLFALARLIASLGKLLVFSLIILLY